MLLCVKKYCDSVSKHFGGKLFYGKNNLEENEIVPARITNPIILGEPVDMKREKHLTSHLSKEFYSSLYIINPKTYEIYSDKLCLPMLNLRHRQLASEEEKLYGFNRWARAFLADIWEDFQRKDALIAELMEGQEKMDVALYSIKSLERDYKYYYL